MSLVDLLTKSQRKRQREECKKNAIAATIGMTVGAIAGVLLAPKAGRETRKDLVNNIHELPDKARVLSGKTKELMSEVKEKIIERAQKTVCGAKEAGSDLKNEMHDGIQSPKATETGEEQVGELLRKLK